MVCLKRIVTLTCCVTRWRSIHWIRVAFTSGLVAGRCMHQPMPETLGRRSFAIFRRCFQWRSRRKMIVVILPAHLRALAGVQGDVQLEVDGPVTRRSILDALEARYPMLRGTIRDHVAGERRPLLRFFACGEDVTHESPDAPLPQPIASGTEPFYIIGAIAGG